MESGRVIHLKSQSEFEKEALKSNIPVIVDFYADWCGPCKKLGPVLEEYCSKEKTFKLIKINVDEAEDLSSAYSVSSIPLVILFNKGKEISRFTGYDASALQSMVAKCKELSKQIKYFFNLKTDTSGGFEGTGVSVGGSSMITMNSASCSEINFLKSNIPAEPVEGTPGAFTIVFKNSEHTLQRRFNRTDTIGNLKSFIQVELKTNSTIDLFENLPKKYYNNDNLILEKSGLSTYQMLMFAFK